MIDHRPCLEPPVDPLDAVRAAARARISSTDATRLVGRPAATAATEHDTECHRLDRYPVYDEVGRGGMGAVVRGRDLDLGRDIAVKVLLETHQDDPEVRQRFVEEAQIGGQLQHPGIVPVYELGCLPGGRPYFTMKLVRGRTLAELLAERRAPSYDLAKLLGLFEQVCQTTAYAHSRGVLHRDLKPANIMVGSFGEVQVMDWGLAKVLADKRPIAPSARVSGIIRTVRTVGNAATSQAGDVLGTPAYMAPEQARGDVDRLDERAATCSAWGPSCASC